MSIDDAEGDGTDASAELIRTMLDRVPAAMWIADTDLRLQAVEGGLLEPTYRKSLVGRDLAEIYPPRGLGHVVEAHQAARSGRSATYELRFQGRVHLACVEPVRNGDGEVTALVGLAVDAQCVTQHEVHRALTAAVGEAVVRNDSLDELLQRCAQAACDVLELPIVRVWMADEERGRLKLHTQAGEPIPILVKELPFGAPSAGRVAEDRVPILGARIDEIAAGELLRWANEAGLVYFDGIPIESRGRLIGVLTAASREVMSPDVHRALRALADELALAIDRERAHDRMRESEARYRQLFDLVQASVFAFDPANLEIVQANQGAAEQFGRAPALLRGMNLRDLIHPADRRRILPWLRGKVAPRARTFCVRTPDGATRDVEASLQDAQWDGRALRVVSIFDVTHRRHAEQMQREMLGRVVEAQEQERRHIARELHDHLGQHLAAQALMIRSVKREVRGARAREVLEELRVSCELVGRELQELAFLLRPAALDDFGIVGALNGLLTTWARQHRVVAHFAAEGLDGCSLDASIETAIYRVAQEALTNVAKHAEAASVELQLSADPESLLMVLRDDGRGMPRGRRHRGAPTEGFGLVSMRDRAQAIGGAVDIESRRGAGTTVRLSLPLTRRTVS